MRRSAMLSLIPLLAAAPLSAQAFEGVVLAKMPIGGSPTDVKYIIKGDKSVTVMTGGASMGPAAGKEIRMITDNTAMSTTMLIPMEMGGSKGIKMVMDMKKVMGESKGTEVKALGTSETIAGYKCDNFQMTTGKTITNACISTQLGTFTFPGSGGMGRGGSSAPAWVSALGGKGGFPLRVTDGDGKVILEVTGVQPGKVSSDEFVIPDGYMSMPGMGGRGGM